jgi:hypothetical protein
MNTIDLKSGTKLPILNFKGKDYLQVAYRLVWFREEHADWSIETDFVYQNKQSALVKALIKDPLGRVIASSHKEESMKDFPAGFREKAETGAIGRALALCGYGTQFEPEFDEGTRIVDSPVGGSMVVPEQPMPGDGVQPQGFVMPATAGRLAGKILDTIDKQTLMDFVGYLDDKYMDKVMPPKTKELYERVVNRVIELEQGK